MSFMEKLKDSYRSQMIMWFFLIFGIPLMIVGMFAAAGYLGRFD
ncbi:hypothetical protein [Tuwongella immobilis]|uniref:Uncharacterized protein n=1 Tax=Tuwongella immobilis TaxID=692036 RepID=A0A6C2YXY0_9BACT|nr:hypothetical protein [Tuwongella immobilis]VIP05709.1 unnamed protein product [Tuwongella immobilis]VTS08774.1 unnamed protein product [Tuwongella immobilis]